MRSAVPQYRHFGGMMMQDGERSQPAVYYGAAEPLQSYQNGGSLEQKGAQYHACPAVAQAETPIIGQVNVTMKPPPPSASACSLHALRNDSKWLHISFSWLIHSEKRERVEERVLNVLL